MFIRIPNSIIDYILLFRILNISFLFLLAPIRKIRRICVMKKKSKKRKKKKTLKIKGDFNEVFKVAVKGNPKPKTKK